MTDALFILGIAGSLRKASFNRALLRAAVEVAPPGVTIETADIAQIPPYDQDVHDVGLPPPVAALRTEVKKADAVLFVTPEYNYSGVLKNAVDWASRPPEQPFAGKAMGVIGASGGPSGTMRAQYHLRQIAVFLDMHPINKPELFVRSAATLFDAGGKLTDEPTRKLLAQYVEALARWARRLKHTA
jgi:chromate reductase